ncbi:KTSC domain-containing protein [Microbacterium sp. 13-71-7]|uniref:KTSC domain-containing protein n=1 Tax=Microbacterium sp. 13-71-7 TaxID=1970399 RepID=UPI0025F9D8E8|nr:KTSC domain-containing protein [Microbacterium sp. 13-71-7]
MNTFDESDIRRDVVGRFAPKSASAPEVSLGSKSTDAFMSARRAALEAHGYLPARSLAKADPSGDISPERWWAAAGLTASNGDGYTVMGRGEGKLRRYEGSEVTLRMPSVASIEAFARQTGTTFDMPVEAATPRGPVTGHVRVTRHEDGRWSVSAVGMPQAEGAYAAEAVNAVLETRRPSLALHDIKDVLQRRRERIAAAGVRLRRVDASSWITGIGYNEADEQLVVEMNGRTYGYHVSREAYQETLEAPSVGRAYNAFVKGQPRYEVAQCERCTRYYNASNTHRCASQHDTARPLTHA